jgi:hypothetical protein
MNGSKSSFFGNFISLFGILALIDANANTISKEVSTLHTIFAIVAFTERQNRFSMTLRSILSSIALVFIASQHAVAQFSIGTWRDHLPYNKCIDLCEVKGEIYCATPYSIFTFDPVFLGMNRISKADLLSDVGITAIEYDSISDYVVVGYENGNLDLITASTGHNIPDIKFSSIIGDKAIYDILPYGNRVYLSTGFGVVVLDMTRLEIKETYFIGNNGGPVKVNDIAIYNNTLYAATETGLQTASLSNPFLANFQNWTTFGELPTDSVVQHIEFFKDQMMVSIPQPDHDVVWKKSMTGGSWQTYIDLEAFRINQLWSNARWFTIAGSYAYIAERFDWNFNTVVSLHKQKLVYAYNCIVNSKDEYLTADRVYGLTWRQEPFTDGKDFQFYPDGPASGDCRRVEAYNNNVWVAHGGVGQDWVNQWRDVGLSGYVDGNWLLIDADTIKHPGGNFNPHNDYVADFMDAAVDPLNNNRVLLGSWEEGLLEVNTTSGIMKTRNGGTNSGPVGSGYTWAQGWTGVASVDFDKEGMLWCTNSYTTEAIHAMDKNGAFYDFDFAPTISNDSKIGDILAASNGLIWTPIIGRGLLVLNYNNTPGTFTDDNFKILTNIEGNGKLPSNDIICMEEDLDGEIWVGTAQGLSIFYNPDAIFSEDNFDSEQILIEQDGNVQILLETEIINCIEIDGSNRKWIGTQNSGVYLFSDDGLQEIYHFTEQNSPLLSNTVFDIAINHENGEVFFATQNGLIGYFSTATNFDPEMSNVRVFPNPVRPEYEGNITIDGLAYNTDVKITDIQGNIVFETESEGGRAIWNGLKYDGGKPATGVYLVYVTTSDGSADDVKKLTIIR